MTRTTSTNGEIQEIPLELLDIGKSQVRTDLSSGIDDLAASIRRQGLLQPIYVAKQPNGRYEILAGQRRFLAHESLKYPSIRAVVVDGDKLDDDARVAISLTENLLRRDNSQKELIDACTKLFKRYASIKMVAEETGLSPAIVTQYVKYDQLIPTLKEKVDGAQLDMKVALQAQKAATSADGTVDAEAAAKFAAELTPLSNTQRKNFVKVVEEDPTESIEERIERGRKQPVLKQVVVTLLESRHRGLQSYAKDEGLNQDEAAAALIEDGLARRGPLRRIEIVFGLSKEQWQNLVLSVNVHRKERRLRPSEVAATLDLALKQTDVDTLARELGFKEPSTLRKIHSLVVLSPPLAATVEWGTRRGGVSMSTASELLLLKDSSMVEEAMKAALEFDLTRTEAQQLRQISRRTNAPIRDCVKRVLLSRPVIERSELILGSLVSPEACEIQKRLGDEEASRRLRLRLATLYPGVTLKSLRVRGSQFSLLLKEDDAAKLRAAVGSKSIEKVLTDLLGSVPLQG